MRFAEFTDEWEKYELSHFVTRITRRNKNNKSSLPLTISAQYGLVDQISFFNKTVASVDLSGYYLLYNGDFAYNKSYSNDYAWGAVKRLDKYEKGCLSSLYFVFRPNDNVDSDYLTHYFESSKWHKGISNIAGEGARNHGLLNMSVDDYFATKHCLPSLPEQKKIARFFNAITRRIEIQNKIISKYETLIKGICFRLLSKIEEYPTVKLSEILTEYCDKTSKNNEFPILSSTMSGIYVQSEYFNKQAACEENVGYKKIPYGYCTYRSMSDTGEFRFNIQKTVQMGIVSPAYPVFTSTIYDIDFVAFYLNKSTRLRKQIIEAKEGGTRFALSFSKLSNLTIPKIAKQQQTKMIEIYHAFLRKEDIERDYLNKLREQKSYLLSKMFI